MDRSLLLVTGAGRSGTSTVAGALQQLGVHVPGPYLGANPSNPRGFYESRWSVEFHNKLLKRASVNITDGRPEALELMRSAVTADDEARLVAFLDEVCAGRQLTVVKDPRTSWVLGLWAQAAQRLDLRLAHLVMLRHPAEVLGSRSTHYFARSEWMGEAGFATKNLAGWVNAMLNTDAQTRGGARAFVRYDDLLSDWRTTLGRALPALGLDVPVPPGPHAVDEFIDPELSRHRLTWDAHDVPPELRELAESVWQSLDRLASVACDVPEGRRPSEPLGGGEASAALDAARQRYADMYLAARRLAFDATQAEVQQARQAAAPPRKATPSSRKAAAAGPARSGRDAAPPDAPGRPSNSTWLARLRAAITRPRP